MVKHTRIAQPLRRMMTGLMALVMVGGLGLAAASADAAPGRRNHHKEGPTIHVDVNVGKQVHRHRPHQRRYNPPVCRPTHRPSYHRPTQHRPTYHRPTYHRPTYNKPVYHKPAPRKSYYEVEFDYGYSAGLHAGKDAGFEDGFYGRAFCGDIHPRWTRGKSQAFRDGFCKAFQMNYASGFRQGQRARYQRTCR